MTVGDILVRFGAETSGFSGGIASMIMQLEGFGAKAAAVGAIIAASLVVAGVAAAVVSAKMAGDFQQGVNRLVTGAGDVTDNMGRMGQSILGISTATGVLTGELLPAMYQIISAGQRGAIAQDTLKVAAMGSVAEQAKIVDVAKALTTAMTDYGTTQFNATQFMNGYTRATQLGKVTLEELSTSMGPILPLARNIGISFADVAGAMSTMTNAGIPAERAATSLRFLFQSLENPTHKATLAMESMGLSSVAVGNELKVSLPGALEMIYKAALRAGPEGSVPFNRAVSDMIGGQRSLQAYLALTGSHFATFASDSKAVAAAMNVSQTAVLGWDLAQTNFNVKLSQAWAAVQALGISLGAQLLPALSGLIGAVTPVLSSFAQWVSQSNVVGNSIHALAAWFSQFSPQVSQVKDALTNLGSALQPIVHYFQQAGTAGVVLHGALDGIKSVIVAVANVLSGLANGLATAIRWFQDGGPQVQRLMTMFSQLGAMITNAFVPAWHSMQQSWSDAMNALQPIMPQLQTLAQVIGGIVVASIILVIAVIGGLIVAFAGVLAGVARIVSGIIQIVAGFVTAVSGYISLMVDLFTGHFDRLGADLDQIMRGILQMFTGALNAIGGVFQIAWAVIVGFAQGFVDTLVALFQGLWQTLVGGSIIPDMCNGIVAAFTGMIASVLGLVSGFIANLIGQFNTLAAQAIAAITAMAASLLSQFQTMVSSGISQAQSLVSGVAGALGQLAGIGASAGAALISSLVGQIYAGVGWVQNAIGSVVASIWNMLPHSPAKEGPLRDLDKFGPALTGGFAAGIRRGTPEVRSAVEMMVAPVPRAVGSVTVASGASAARGSGSGGSNAMLDVLLRIERKLDSGRRVTREELVQAMGSTLSERVMQYGSGR